MNFIYLLPLFAAASSGSPLQLKSELDEHWQHFKNTFKKSYSGGVEETRRRLIWQQRMEGIDKHNLKADMGLHSYRRGLNKYSDLNYLEFLRLLNGFRIINHALSNDVIYQKTGANVSDHVDWRDAGLVTPIYDQGPDCGACWAFSATGSIEGQLKKKTGQLVHLSEQNLLDCCTVNKGCDGGDMETAFECVKKMEGIEPAKSYPYTAKEGKCHFNKKNVAATLKGYAHTPKGDEEALKEAVATIGPLSVAIDAHHESFHDYKTGIFDEPDCGNDLSHLTHALLLIGYGTEDGKDYWLLKNSWGETFGMNGYVKMSRNKKNQCGIATKASYPLL